jgi:hypothetical protein
MKIYLPVERHKLGKTPWGYAVPTDASAKFLMPIKEDLDILEKGFDFLDEGASFQKVADYVSSKTGKPISHATVRNRYFLEEDRAEGREKRKKLVSNYTENHGTKKRKRRTPEEKAILKLGNAKRKVSGAQRKLENLRKAQEAHKQELESVKPASEASESPVVREQEMPPETVPAEPAPSGAEIIRPNPGPQTDFLAAPERDVLYGGAAGGGKAQPTDAIVYTPIGARKIGELKIGDVVISPKGHQAKVIQIHPQGKQEIYKVTFQDGSSAECTSDHLWYCKKVRDGKNRWGVRNLKTLLENKGRGYCVPLTSPVYMEEQAVPIHPYVLGCILGDGCVTANAVSYTSNDQEIIDKMSKYVTISKHAAKFTYGILGITKHIKDLGLKGKGSYTKFIPDSYLHNSIENRLELLRGLLDTDGYVSSDGNVNYTSMSDVMRGQVSWLVRSLGGTATTFKGHSLYIRHPNSANLFSLRRKKNRCHTKNINNRILSIKKVDNRDAVCITIDDKDQLYLTNNFIVTHNSFALIIDPLRTVHLKSHKAITFRRTTDELRSLIAMTKDVYPKVIPGAKFLEQKSTWVFPGGGSHWYRFLDRDDDVTSLQGQDFSWIGFDELTQWSTPFVYNYMRSRLRTTDPDMKPLLAMRSTSNPGGPGHDWVKRTFISPAPPNTTFPAQDLETGDIMRWTEDRPDLGVKRGDILFYRKFIPAKLKDNPYLYNDGGYESSLLSLPEVQKRQLLDGDWDIAEGAAFTEFRRSIHTCEPFPIPNEWRKFRACDWGYDKPHCVLWFAMAPSGKLYVYRELYGRRVLSPDLADKVLTAEMGENIMYGILDRHAWDMRDGAATPAQGMIARGCQWRPASQGPGSRLSGKQEVHRRLAIQSVINEVTGEEKLEPSVVIFNTCLNLIRTLPSIPLDKSNTEDVDSDSEDHAYDAFRYGLTSKPMARNERYVTNAISFVPVKQYDSFGFPK